MAAKKKRDLMLVGGGPGGEAAHLKYPAHLKDLCRKTMCAYAEDDEFELFLHFCLSNNVDPLKGEAWFQIRFSKKKDHEGRDVIDERTNKPKYERKPVFGLTIKAVRNRLEERPDYAGHEVQVVYTNDEFSYDSVEKKVHHVIKTLDKRQRGAPIAAWGQLDKKDKRPTIKILYLSERFQEKSYNWKSMGDTMITKCCEMDLIRAAYPKQFGSIYTPEEMELRDDEALDPSRLQPVEATVKKTETPALVVNAGAAAVVDKFAKGVVPPAEPEVPAEVTVEEEPQEEDKADERQGSPFVTGKQYDQLQNILREYQLTVAQFCKLINNEFRVKIRKVSQVRKPMMPILMRKFSQVAEGALNFKKDTLSFEGPPPTTEDKTPPPDDDIPF